MSQYFSQTAPAMEIGKIYFDNVNLYAGGSTATKLYDGNLKLLLETSMGYDVNNILFNNDLLIIRDSNYIYQYKNYKLVKKSGEYSKVYAINNNGAIVKNLRSEIYFVDYNDILSPVILVMDNDMKLNVDDFINNIYGR